MAYDIGPKIGIEGEKAFRDAITAINTSFKTLGAEMSAVTSAFDKNDKSSKALTAQNGVLNKQIDLQKQKLIQLNSGLAQATEKYGAADKVTQGWQQAVNKATAELNNMDRELAANNKSIAIQDSNWTKLGKSLDTIGTKMKTVGAGLSSAGKSMTMGLTAPILGAVAGLGAMVMKSSKTADELQKLSDVTGLSAERLQELKYAGSALGVELETITGAQAKLTKAMVAAEKGTGAQAEAFKKLKVDAFDPATGAMRDSKVVMEELFTALNGVSNETERDSLAMQLFGKSGMALNPIIKAGGVELAKLTDEARKNGAVMSNESVAGLDKFGDSLDAMKLSISGAVGEAASKLMPIFEKLTPIIQDKIVPAIGKFAQTIANLIIKFTTLDPGTQKLILGFGAFLLVIGPIVSVIGAIVTAVGGAVAAFGAVSGAIAAAGGALAVLTSPIGIAVIAIAALALAVGGLVIWYQSANKEAIAMNKEVNTLVQSCKTSAEAFKTQNDELETNAGLAAKLADELYALNNKEVKTNVDKARMGTLIQQLNGMYVGLNLAISKETGLLNKSKLATTALITEKEKQLKFEVYAERMKTLIGEQVGLEEKLNKATVALTGSTEEMTKAEIDAAIVKVMNNRSDLERGAAIIPLEVRAYQDLEKQLGLNTAAQNENRGSWGDLADAELASTAANDTVTQDNVDMLATQEQYYSDLESATQTHYANMNGFNEAANKDDEVTLKEWIANLKQQQADYRIWIDEMKLLAPKVPAAMIQEFIDAGPEGVKVIQGMNAMTGTELNKTVALWANSGRLAKEGALLETGQIPGAVSTIFANLKGLMNGTDLGPPAVKIGQGIANGITNAITAGTNSASTAAWIMGQAILRNLQAGAAGTVQLPKIKAGSGDTIGWHAAGAIFMKPTLLNGGRSGVGEVPEVVLPLSHLAGMMADTLNAMQQKADPMPQNSTTINFNGSYSFAGQKDIDYFMNQAAVLVQRRAG